MHIEKDPQQAASRIAPLLGLWAGMRPRQWVKNGFVFAPLLFSGHLLEPGPLLTTAAAALLFSLLSSALYLVNDIADRDRDRMHPVKRQRPIAAGVLPVRRALAAAVLMGSAALAGAFLLRPGLGWVTLLYGFQTVAYSYYLKRLVLVDVFVIALGFVLRVVAGGQAIAVPLSPWLLLVTMLVALFIGLAKRRHELTVTENPEAHRGILAEYSVPLVDQLITLTASSTVVLYSLYSFSASQDERLIYTVPFVLFGMARYLYLIHRRQGGGEPENLVLQDKPLLGTLLLWGLTVILILYGR